jgi:hypothetical protein
MLENMKKMHDKLIIIAGACQSDYEELIKRQEQIMRVVLKE